MQLSNEHRRRPAAPRRHLDPRAAAATRGDPALRPVHRPGCGPLPPASLLAQPRAAGDRGSRAFEELARPGGRQPCVRIDGARPVPMNHRSRGGEPCPAPPAPIGSGPVQDDRRRRRAMIRDGVTTLQGFAWYVRNRPGVESPGTGGHPFDGVESKYWPLCWPIGPGESGVRNHAPGPAFLVITPALTLLAFGPPEVGRAWQVEPAELDGFRTEDG